MTRVPSILMWMERQLTDEPIKQNRQCSLITGAYLDDEPNAAVMSVAEEAGITHFKTLLQRRSQISAKSTQSLCPTKEVVLLS